MKKLHIVERKYGYALVTVLAAISVATMLVTGVVKFGMQRTYSVRRLGDRAKAITYSEAGLDYVYSKISQDFSLRNDAERFPAATYGQGSYEILLSNVTSNSVLVTCVGYCGSASNKAAISIRNYADQSSTEDQDNSGEAWDYAIVTGGEIQWSGCGTFSGDSMIHSGQAFLLKGSGEVNADVYSPSRISLSGNACELNGDASAPFIEDSKGNIQGVTTQESVASISLPNIDLDPYYQEALANGQVYDGDFNQSFTSDYTPPGGVIWVNGNVKISGQGVITACIIATGEISSSLAGGVTAYGSYPALVSRDGNLKIASQGDYTGLLYAPSGEFQMSGSGTITGQIMAAGNMLKSGCSSAFVYMNAAPISPGESESEDEDLIGISAWEK